ncbi:Orange carotenoid-binding protein [Tolypothrix sp. FACHB-123]|uniref:orange carotenoid protein N-terminal domain-containing protein n=1 Tax=Tolypothrix sp. FACHB-123 TaxID=2692868 RepID=UPI0016843872|nr:orange carotenoid protein N-terminal domain-containing protein [Tolypothrix sp. FACHB-123]MBD2353882.1 Orange carotenoid-binding protein [Tolypothrix sp. FACHB-123]
MTSTNVNFLEQAVSKFNNLNADERLSVLASLYTQIADEIPAIALNNEPNEKTANLVAQVQKLPQAEQILALRQLFNPKEANNTSISIEEYAAMSPDLKLGFWYQLAQNLGTCMIGIPDDYIPSEESSAVLDLLDTPNIEDIVNFLKQVV